MMATPPARLFPNFAKLPVDHQRAHDQYRDSNLQTEFQMAIPLHRFY